MLQGLTHRFGGVTALAGFDLQVAAGELVCLIGPNGCGKTTVFNAISGLLPLQEGRIDWQGASLRGLPPHEIARRGIGRKFQTPALFDSLTVAQHLQVAAWARAKAHDPLPHELIAPLLEPLLAEIDPDAPAHTLAHGQRQSLELATLLAAGPRLLLLDEPTAGLTQAQTRQTITLLRALCTRAQLGVLIVEHDMRFVQDLDARVVVMLAGRVIAVGPYAQVRTLPQVQEAYLGHHA